MRVLLAVTLAFWATFSIAQDDDIRGAIGAQIEAFKADDFDQAFTYASPLIQGLFGDSDRFGLMVRNGRTITGLRSNQLMRTRSSAQICKRAVRLKPSQLLRCLSVVRSSAQLFQTLQPVQLARRKIGSKSRSLKRQKRLSSSPGRQISTC